MPDLNCIVLRMAASRREQRRNAVGLRQVCSIARQLDLRADELGALLIATPEDLETWLAQAETDGLLTCTPETVERISLLLGIWRCLVVLFPAPANRGHWLRAANTAEAFKDQSPLNIALSSGLQGLRLVRDYLEHQCG
jgi:hypothetical protein